MITGEQTAQLAAAPGDVYDVVAGVDRYPDWQGIVREVQVRERDGEGRPAVVQTALDAKAVTLKLVLAYAYEPGERVRWTYVDGDVKDAFGAWELAPAGDGATRVTYRLTIDPGFRLGLLLRGGVEERLRRRVLDGTLDELRARLG